jgi:hypothetical protein
MYICTVHNLWVLFGNFIQYEWDEVLFYIWVCVFLTIANTRWLTSHGNLLYGKMNKNLVKPKLYISFGWYLIKFTFFLF